MGEGGGEGVVESKEAVSDAVRRFGPPVFSRWLSWSLHLLRRWGQAERSAKPRSSEAVNGEPWVSQSNPGRDARRRGWEGRQDGWVECRRGN